MSHTVKIKDEAYSLLTGQAASVGISPELWVESAIYENSARLRKKPSEKKRREAWNRFIGAIDSSQVKSTKRSNKSRSLADRVKETFSDVVEEKMKRIGLRIHK